MSSVTNNTPSETPLPRPVADGVELGEAEHLQSDTANTATIVSTSGDHAFEMTPEQLESLKVGETVRALQRSGNEVSVVDLFVVDQQEALDALQLILSRQEVSRDEFDRVRSEEHKNNLKRDSHENGKLAQGKTKGESWNFDQSSLIAVYVEATESQLAGTLEELKQEHRQFVELAVQDPIETEKLSEALEKRDLTSIRRNSPSGAKESLADIQTPGVSEENGTHLEFTRESKGLGGGADIANRIASDSPRQQALQVSPQKLKDLTQSGRNPTVSDQVRSTAKSAVLPSTKVVNPPQASTGKVEETIPSEEQLTRQMQVLFVLKQRPQTFQKARIAPPAINSPRDSD